MINQSAIWDEYCTYRGKFFHGPNCPNGHDGKHVTLAGMYYGSVYWEQYSPLVFYVNDSPPLLCQLCVEKSKLPPKTSRSIPACPNCLKADSLKRIIYGLVDPEAMEGNGYTLGGCVVRPENWFCESCKLKFQD